MEVVGRRDEVEAQLLGPAALGDRIGARACRGREAQPEQDLLRPDAHHRPLHSIS